MDAIMNNEVAVCIILGDQDITINSSIENYNIWKQNKMSNGWGGNQRSTHSQYDSGTFNLPEGKSNSSLQFHNNRVDKMDPLEQLEMYIQNIQLLCHEMDKVS
jgi:hypothetical protein